MRQKQQLLKVVNAHLLVLIVFMDNGQRRIPVTFARRVVGRKEMGGNSTYIPLKVNQSGVIPIPPGFVPPPPGPGPRSETLLNPISRLLAAFNDGRVSNYYDVIELSR